jgi:hypothetical protein
MSSPATKHSLTTLSRENPFPGLRPYDEVDAEWFFGRGREINELLKRLGRVRFLAVVGPSGCGKSSLIRAGVLPGVRDGYLDAKWNVVILRPGEHPLDNLAAAISFGEFGDISAVRKALDYGPLSLVEAIVRQGLGGGANTLILVDQFEELFQYVQRKGDAGSDDAKQFLKLLLTAAASDAAPVYIVITMRLEWLNECATYMGLAEAINEGIYLVPQPSRRQFQQVILGPIEAAGRSITSSLLDRMLNDLDGRTDQLPVLQHALMRMWQRRVTGGVLEVSAYEAVGTLSDCLSNHAEEIISELTDSEKKAAELLFRSITQVYKGRKVRRPRPLGEITDLTGIAAQPLETVVAAFRQPGRSFLVGTSMSLGPETVIDISHEALIRQWRRLGEWVDIEADVQAKESRLEEIATEWDKGHRRDSSVLYRGASLRQAKELRPSVRSHSTVAAFLSASRKAEFWGRVRSRGSMALIVLLFLITLTSLAVQALTKAKLVNQLTDAAHLQASREAQVQESLANLAKKGSSAASILKTIQAKRIYLQYVGNRTLALAQAVQAYLTLQGYAVPGAELVNSNKAPRVTQVRYFYPEDRPQAQEIVGLLRNILTGTATAQQTANPNNVVPQGQLEVWLSAEATGCMAPYVWRKAGPNDFVCVTPQVKAQAQQDKAQAAARRAGGGTYGPDTCKTGYVWREAFQNDHVCVDVATRTQAANDNREAASRLLPPQ